jgi:hypothetical protein
MAPRKLTAEEVKALGLDAEEPSASAPRKLSPDEAKALGLDDDSAPAPTPGPRDFGAANTFGAHFARHLSFGLGDKVTAAIESLQDLAHSKTKTLSDLPDIYRSNLAFNDKTLERADAEHPVARWAGNVAGVAGSMAVPIGAARLAASGALGANAAAQSVGAAGAALPQLARAGRNFGTVAGGLGAFGADRSDSALGTAANTALGTTMGALAGYASPYVGAAIGRGAGALGERAKDLAGWLKVNSLHPTPTLGEAMEQIPGGRVGVGTGAARAWRWRPHQARHPGAGGPSRSSGGS